ncbi:acrosomal protein KIAA1210 homolog [Molossus nigricans]
MAFPEIRKTGVGRQSGENQEFDMHCEMEMVAGQLVIGIWSLGKRSSLDIKILESRIDLTMDESLNEASANLEVLEASDEGKKKSKFKAFKKIFGKKKKKEPEDAQGGRSLKSSLSSINNSSLNLVQEDQQSKSRIERRMGNKALSHDSIFMLKLEPKTSESKTYPSSEPQRGRSLERSHVSRSLPITGSMPRAVSGSLFEVMPHYVQRSEVWVAGSKITEIPPWRPRQASVSPPRTGSDTISKDIEEISADDESPMTSQKKALPKKLTVEKVPPQLPCKPSVSPTDTGSDTDSKDFEEISADDESPKTPQKKAFPEKKMTVEKIPPQRQRQPRVSPTHTGSDTVSKDFEEISADDGSPKTPQKKLSVEKILPQRPRQPRVSPTHTGSDTVSKDFEEISADDGSPKTPQKKALPKKLSVEKIPPQRQSQPSVSPTHTGSDTISKDIEEISAADETPKTPQKKALPKKKLTVEKISPKRQRQPNVSPTHTGSDTVSADDESPKTPQKKALPMKKLTVEKIPPQRQRQPKVSPSHTGSDTVSAADESPKTPQKKALPMKKLTVEKIPPQRQRQPKVSPSHTGSDTVSADDESPKTPQKKALPMKKLTVEKIPPQRQRQPKVSPSHTGSDTVSAADESPKTPQKKALPMKKLTVEKIPPQRQRQPKVSPSHTGSDTVSADDESPKTPQKKALPMKKLTVEKIPPQRQRQPKVTPSHTGSDTVSADDESPKTLQKRAFPKKKLTVEKRQHRSSISATHTGSDTVSKEFEEISADDESPKTPQKKALPMKKLTVEKRRVSPIRTRSDTASKGFEEISADDESPTTPQKKALPMKKLTMEKIPPWPPCQLSVSPPCTRSDTVSKDFEEISADDESPTTPQKKALPMKKLTVEKIPPQRPHQPSISPTLTGSDTVSKDFEEISADDESPTTPQKKALPMKKLTVEKIPPRHSHQPSISPTHAGSDIVSKDFEEISAADESPTTPQKKALPMKKLSMEKVIIPPLRPHQPSVSPPRTRSDKVSKDSEEISAVAESPKTPPEKALPKKMLSMEKIPPLRPQQPRISPPYTRTDTVSKAFKEISAAAESPKTLPEKALPKMLSVKRIPPLHPHQPSVSPPRTRAETVSKGFEEISVADESPKTQPEKALPQKMLSMKKIPPLYPYQPFISPTCTGPDTVSKYFEEISYGDEFLMYPQKAGFPRRILSMEKIPSLRRQRRNISATRTGSDTISKDLKEICDDDESPTTSQKKALLKKMFTMEKIPPLRPHQPSIHSTRTGSDTIYKDSEEISAADESPKTPSEKALPQKMLTARKSSFEPSSRPIRAQSFTTLAMLTSPSSPQLPTGFSIPPTTQGCLDSSAARHRMALNPRKQKKNLQATVKPEQEEPSLPLASEDKSKTKPKAADQKKFKEENAGPSSQERSHETEIYKATDQASNTDAAVKQAHSWPAAYGRQHGKKESHALVAEEAQVYINPYLQSEEEDSSSFDSQITQFKIESVQDISTICKEKPPGNALQAFTASALAEGGISVERLPPRSISQSLRKPEAEDVPSDSDKSPFSEEGSGSKQQLDPKYSFQTLRKPKDDKEAFVKSSSFVGKLSRSREQLAPRCASQALGEPEDKVSTESKSYHEKYKAKDWSSPEEDMPRRHPSLALGKSTDQQEISVSKNTLEEWGVSVEQAPPRHLPQPFVRPLVQQQLSSGAMSASSEWVPMPPRHLSQPWLSPTSKQQTSAGSESIASDWGIVLEPLPPRIPSKRLMRHKAEQKISGPEIATIKGIKSMELQPSRNSQPPVKRIAEQAISAGPESTAVKRGISMEPLPPKVFAQPLMNPVVEQKVFLGSEGAEKVISVEPTFSEYCPQYLTNPQDQHILSENTASNEDMFVELPPPKYPCQPLVRHKFQPQSASTEWSSPVELMPPRHTFCPWGSTSFQQQSSAGPESTAADWGIPVEPLPPRMPSQPLLRPVAKQEVFSGSMKAPAEWSGLVEPMPPRYTFQPWMSPEFEQQAYAGPESAVAERSISMEPLISRKPPQPLIKPVVKQPISTGPKSVAVEGDTSTDPPRHWSIVRHKVQQMIPSFEKAAGGCVSGRRLPPEYPIHFSIKSKVQEISSHLENIAVEGGMSKKSQHPRCPSQSYVKFMAQHIFSGSPAMEEQVYAGHLSSNQPSKSLLRPNVEHQVFSGWESADIEGGISSKLLPTKGTLQSLERPEEDPQEVFSYSDKAPVKCSYPQEQLPPRYRSQAWGKLEYEQEVSSVSESSLEEWKRSEEHMPSKCSFQAKGGAEFQPQVFSTGSVGVPVEWSSAEAHLPPRHAFQALADPGSQQQVFPSSLSAAAKETIFESNPSSWSQPRGPASPSKTGKRSQGSEDPIKNIPTLTTKPVKFPITPVWPMSTSGGTYSKVEVLESRDQNNGDSNVSTHEADVENVFGVRLRKIPAWQKKYKNKEQKYFTKIPSLSLGQISSSIGKPQIRSASQGHPGIAETRTTTSDVAEKQQSKSKYDSMPKKKPDYKIPGKAPGHQFDYATSEPAWITMAKQKQRNFRTQVFMKELKIKNRVGAKASTTVPRYEGADLAHQSQQRKISTFSVNRQEKMAPKTLPTSTKAGFEKQKIFQVPATRKETRQSSAHPAMFQGPVEPVWFSMAKKKAKAWSHITETMQ